MKKKKKKNFLLWIWPWANSPPTQIVCLNEHADCAWFGLRARHFESLAQEMSTARMLQTIGQYWQISRINSGLVGCLFVMQINESSIKTGQLSDIVWLFSWIVSFNTIGKIFEGKRVQRFGTVKMLNCLTLEKCSTFSVKISFCNFDVFGMAASCQSFPEDF